MANLFQNNSETTVVGYSRSEQISFLIILPILGIVLGYFIPTIAHWLVTLPWIPFTGPIEVIALFPEKWVTIIAAIIGLVAGVLLAAVIFEETLELIVTNKTLQLKRKDKVQLIPRVEIASVFLDKKELVILVTSTEKLAREPYDMKIEKIEQALSTHGYPWSAEGDPYENDYHRWVVDMPDLRPTLNTLLKARERSQKMRKKMPKIYVVN